jgi:predicted transcriptional regulator
MAVLGKLKKMLDAGLIESSEYEAKKTEILSRM